MQRFLGVCIHMFLILLMIIPTARICFSGACNQTENVISLLKQLQSDISALPNKAFKRAKNVNVEKGVLCNKINAVISQVNTGAFKGCLRKLTNDVEKRIKKRILSPWKEKLLDLIKQIRCLIENLLKCRPPADSKPPSIHEVLYYPSLPEYDDSVLVLAYVTDCWSGVANVTLSYSVNSGEDVNITMSKTDDLYTAEIPPQSYNATVSFFVYAFDNAGNMAVSPIYSYIVGDSISPIISYVERIPAIPNYNETVLVYVNATEPPFASGVKNVVLSYSNGAEWVNETMNFNPQKGLYFAEIPAFPFGTFVEYVIYAFDYAGNVAVTHIYSYTVDDPFLPVAILNVPEYVSGSVMVSLYVYDDNLLFSKLAVDGEVLAYFNKSGNYLYLWNTVGISEGTHILRLDAYDRASNHGWAECRVVVDNTAPKIGVEWPRNGSYVRGLVAVKVTVEDINIELAELAIDELKYVWRGAGTFTFVWETTKRDDGWYTINLRAVDRAGNENKTSLKVFVDNAVPLLGNLTWNPSAPLTGESVNVSVQAFDDGSGVKNVTLWFRTDESAWQLLNMTFKDGNWTCTIPGQDENRIVLFYVECYDNVGNYARTMEYIYVVRAAPAQQGLPLGWLLLIIIVIGLAIALTTYIYGFKRRRRTGRTVALIQLK